MTLSASFSGATGTIRECGFLYGTSSSSLSTRVTATGTGSPFSVPLSSLTTGTTYWYKAYVSEYNTSTSSYEERYGATLSFTLGSKSTQPGYLGCYEVPAITDLTGESTTGSNSSRDDKWTRYYTSSSTRQVAVHTFTHPTSGDRVRTYTVLYDGSRYAPLWTAHAMHSSMWPDKNVGRNDGWEDDPAISLKQQTGISGSSYSRGHFVASSDRQSSKSQNQQTFYHSNQAPQWQNDFNGGIWSTLENDIQGHLPSGRDTLYVVTGVLYEGSVKTMKSGNGLSVAIPSHFYKCLMKCSFDSAGQMTASKGCAYLFENKAYSSGTPSNYTTTIDAIEARTGFDFFPAVPNSLQSTAEASSTPLW